MANPTQQQRTRLQEGSSSGTATPTSGSQTLVEPQASSSNPSATLRLRASPDQASARHIRWSSDVIDNEGMGKKSSKVCCIYHKPHEPGESDSESSSSSDDDSSDDEPDLSRAQRGGGGRGRKHGTGDKGDGKGKGKERKPSPNAYERQPKYKSKNDG
ncbi:Hypothetical predicted protein [Lecanosticta acicola]|uniref:Type 1 phosphatases regulator n=1 Tax=Lecanosticta acicola TaxID=111012 RepID=A0AAI8YYN5_9PEZI|nr:Hypothetical predicted protein [Lecanosticta acicola]